MLKPKYMSRVLQPVKIKIENRVKKEANEHIINENQ